MAIRRRTPPLPLPDTTRMDLTTAELRHLATLARRRRCGRPGGLRDLARAGAGLVHAATLAHRSRAMTTIAVECIAHTRPNTAARNPSPPAGRTPHCRPTARTPHPRMAHTPAPDPRRRLHRARPLRGRGQPQEGVPRRPPLRGHRLHPPRQRRRHALRQRRPQHRDRRARKRRAPANASPASPSSAPAGRPSSGVPPAGTAPASTVNYHLRALERKGWIQLIRGKDRDPGGGANQPEGSRAPQRPTLTSWMPSQLWQTRISV